MTTALLAAPARTTAAAGNPDLAAEAAIPGDDKLGFTEFTVLTAGSVVVLVACGVASQVAGMLMG